MFVEGGKTKVKAEPLTLPHFIAWLEKQPADQRYDYNDCDGGCLLDTYITSVTGESSTPSGLHYKICGDADGTRYAQIARALPWTFGAALKRARAVANAS